MEHKVLVTVKRTFWEKILGKVRVAYLDTHEFYIDKEFPNYKLKQFAKVDDRYRLMFISISKKDLPEFKEITNLIRNRALICGFRDYDKIWDQMYNAIWSSK